MTKRTPKYRLHKATGQAVVSFGRNEDVYLGKYDSPASWAKYGSTIAEWKAAGCKRVKKSSGTTVARLAEAFMEHSSEHYRKRGRITSRHRMGERICEQLVALYGLTPVADFGVIQFKAIRHAWIDRESGPLCRSTINGYAMHLRHIFRWGVEEGLVPIATYQTIKAVSCLSAGRSKARETDPVTPAPDDAIDAVAAALKPPHRDKVLIQRLTGMRPGEVCAIRPCDIDRSGPAWIYSPDEHKTEHKGKSRKVPLGPKAQSILADYLVDTPDDGWIFAPRVKRKGRRPFTPALEAGRYRMAIRNACIKLGIAHWHPNQLRHNAATEIRKRFGIESAQHVLGHAKADMTEIYAEKNLDVALAVAVAMG